MNQWSTRRMQLKCRLGLQNTLNLAEVFVYIEKLDRHVTALPSCPQSASWSYPEPWQLQLDDYYCYACLLPCYLFCEIQPALVIAKWFDLWSRVVQQSKHFIKIESFRRSCACWDFCSHNSCWQIDTICGDFAYMLIGRSYVIRF